MFLLTMQKQTELSFLSKEHVHCDFENWKNICLALGPVEKKNDDDTDFSRETLQTDD